MCRTENMRRPTPNSVNRILLRGHPVKRIIVWQSVWPFRNAKPPFGVDNGGERNEWVIDDFKCIMEI